MHFIINGYWNDGLMKHRSCTVEGVAVEVPLQRDFVQFWSPNGQKWSILVPSRAEADNHRRTVHCERDGGVRMRRLSTAVKESDMCGT